MPPDARLIPNRSVLGRNISRDLHGDELLKKMTAYVKKQVRQNNPEFVNIALGDVVIIESESDYRNDGVFMWNGKKVIKLYTEVDDYGSVPPEIEIADDNDFTAYSWQDLVNHNNFVWYSPEIRDRIKDTLNDHLTAQVNIRGTMWTFHIDNNQRRFTVEQVKLALDENRVIFNASDYDNNIEMFASNQVHGTVRRRARASTSRRVTGTTSRRARNPPADPAVAEAELQRAAAAEAAAEAERQRAASAAAERRRASNVARIEAELAAARENVAQLERQLAAARVGGGKRHRNKK